MICTSRHYEHNIIVSCGSPRRDKIDKARRLLLSVGSGEKNKTKQNSRHTILIAGRGRPNKLPGAARVQVNTEVRGKHRYSNNASMHQRINPECKEERSLGPFSKLSYITGEPMAFSCTAAVLPTSFISINQWYLYVCHLGSMPTGSLLVRILVVLTITPLEPQSRFGDKLLEI